MHVSENLVSHPLEHERDIAIKQAKTEPEAFADLDRWLKEAAGDPNKPCHIIEKTYRGQ